MAINDQYSQSNRYLRRAKRSVSRAGIDLTVTPPDAGSVAGQINAGDFVYKTGNAGAIASLRTTGGVGLTNSALVVGISAENYPPLLFQGVSLPAPVNDPTPVSITFRVDGEHVMKTTVADTYVPGALVYLGADAQTVTVVSTGNGSVLGRVCFDQAPVGVAIGASVVGATTPEVVIELTPPIAA